MGEGRNEYTYSASGVKLRVKHRWNPDYSTTPVIGSAINENALTVTEVTEYVGNKVYTDGKLKVLVDGGYIEDNKYHYYIKDHLGNNRIVVDQYNNQIQSSQYYPFGMTMAESTGQEKQPYKYNGKEMDKKHGLDWYDYSARNLAMDIPRFTSVDPHAERYYNISPYVYTLNNPLRWIDKDGRDPGDPFKTRDDAAKDFAKYYNGNSIVRKSEQFLFVIQKRMVNFNAGNILGFIKSQLHRLLVALLNILPKGIIFTDLLSC